MIALAALLGACVNRDADVPVAIVLPDPGDIAASPPLATDPFAGVATLRLEVRAGTPGGKSTLLARKLYPASATSLSVHGLAGGHGRFVVLEGLAETIDQLAATTSGGTVLSRGTSAPDSYVAANQTVPSGNRYPPVTIFFARVGEFTPLPWRATASPQIRLLHAHAFFGAADLGNDRIAFAGGIGDSGLVSDKIDVLDVRQLRFIPAHGLAHPRAWPMAAPLPGGGALIAGGVASVDSAAAPIDSVERLDGDGTPDGKVYSMTSSRMYGGMVPATVGGQSRVVIAGGSDTVEPDAPDSSVDWWNGKFVDGFGSLNIARSWLTATPLAGGRALFAGGYARAVVGPGETIKGPTDTAELLDTSDVSAPPFRAVANRMGELRWAHAASPVVVGGTAGVLRAGGSPTLVLDSASGAELGVATAGADLFLDPPGGPALFSTSGVLSMREPRALAAAAPLPDGGAIVTGGVPIAGALPPSIAPLASCEIFDPATRAFVTDTAQLPVLRFARVGHAAIALPNGDVLVAGGLDASGVALETVEIYVPRWENDR